MQVSHTSLNPQRPLGGVFGQVSFQVFGCRKRVAQWVPEAAFVADADADEEVAFAEGVVVAVGEAAVFAHGDGEGEAVFVEGDEDDGVVVDVVDFGDDVDVGVHVFVYFVGDAGGVELVGVGEPRVGVDGAVVVDADEEVSGAEWVVDHGDGVFNEVKFVFFVAEVEFAFEFEFLAFCALQQEVEFFFVDSVVPDEGPGVVVHCELP